MGTKKNAPKRARKVLGKGTMKKTKGGLNFTSEASEPEAVGMLLPAVQAAREAARR